MNLWPNKEKERIKEGKEEKKKGGKKGKERKETFLVYKNIKMPDL